jgi:hypothetical protein
MRRDSAQADSVQVGCVVAPPLLWQHFYLPGIVLICALGQIIPEQKVLQDRILRWEQFKD